MNTKAKIRYEQPLIYKIRLDDVFSLSLESLPPLGPGESIGQNFGLPVKNSDQSDIIV